MFAIHGLLLFAVGMFQASMGVMASALPAEPGALCLGRAGKSAPVVVTVVAGNDADCAGPQRQKTVACTKVIRLDGPGAACGGGKKEARCFTIKLKSDGDVLGAAGEAAPMMMILSDDEDEPTAVARMQAFQIDDEKDSPEKPVVKRLELVAEAGGNIEPGGPWLGVSYGPVPKPLAVHLKLAAESGQMVLNIAAGSPADQAGLEQYDVIVKIDGEAAPAAAGAFMEQIHDLKPGQALKLTIIHQGRQTEKGLTIGERPEDMGSVKQKYEADTEELSQGRVLRRGGLLERDDQGNWKFKRFDLPDMPDVFQWLPEGEEFTFELPVPGGPEANRHVFIFKTDDKKSLRLERGDGDEMKVMRTESDADGSEKTTTKVYTSEDELQKDDPEAFELTQKAPADRPGGLTEKRGWFRRPGKPGAPHGGTIDIDVQEFRKQAEEMQKQAEEMKKQFGQNKNLDELRKEYLNLSKERSGRDAERNQGLAQRLLEQADRPRTSFELLPGGEIRVTQRQGESELVETYQNADDLKEKRPELYRKFEKLQGDGGKKARRQ